MLEKNIELQNVTYKRQSQQFVKPFQYIDSHEKQVEGAWILKMLNLIQ